MKIGPYEVVETMSKSSQAVSYRAIHATLRREVFLKVLPAGGERQKERRARFEQEARALATVDHPAVVRVYEFGEWEGMLYLASEFLSGPDLGKLVAESGPLDWPTVREMAEVLLEGLHKLHEAQIIHRDIKPTNIVMGKTGPKLADLGLARVTESPVATRSDTLLGSPAYMAPEILRGVPAGPKTDLFSLGATLFEILTGERAFKGETFQEVLANLARCDPFSQRTHHLPNPACRFLSALLSKNPEDRPHDALDARRLLLGSNETRSRGQPSPRRVRWEIVVVPILFVLAAIIVWQLRKPLTSPAHQQQIDVRSDSVEAHTPVHTLADQTVIDSAVPSVVAAKDSAPMEKTSAGQREVHGVEAPEPAVTVTERHEEPSDLLLLENEPPMRDAELWVFCAPWGEISLDGIVVDTTPLSLPLRMEPGDHMLRFNHPAFPPVELLLETGSGTSESLYVSLPDSAGYLKIHTVPWANISVDGTLAGTTPLAEPLVVSPGIHAVIAQNPFYGEESRQLTVARGETTFVAIDFTEALER